MDSLQERDRRVSWHPYTQHGVETSFLPVASAKDATLFLEDGRGVLDAISSWWSILHGHGNERLASALASQAAKLDHVLFAGATHEPAIQLAEELTSVAPEGLTRVFYSDNGSTAIEVALKMAYQRWVHIGQPERRVFVALDGAYHGDTFGAMAIGDRDPFFLPFEPLLFEVERVAPESSAIERAFEKLGPRAAGLVLEPLVQGAVGMRMQTVDFVRDVRELCDRAGVPLIADEVMTGFGRTGSLFACEKAGVAPDLMCLAKGLTGGIFPLSATLATEEIFEAFVSDDHSKAFFHGHTFTANPIGCAVALESLALVRENDVPRQLDAVGARIEGRIREGLGEKANGLRRYGGIVAYNQVAEKSGYFGGTPPEHRAPLALEHGVLLRPLGDVIYALPPACTTEAECDRIADAMIALGDMAHQGSED